MIILACFFIFFIILSFFICFCLFFVFTNAPLKINNKYQKEEEQKQNIKNYQIQRSKFKLIAVYFVNGFINPTHDENLMKDQLQKDLINDCDEFHIALSIPKERPIPNLLKDLIKDNDKIKLHINYESIHEYPGIHLLWELGKKNNENTVFLYFHSKGITHISPKAAYKRNEFEEKLYNQVIRDREKYFSNFIEQTNIKKVGFSVSLKGCIWHNYYFVKNDYLKQKEEPIITEDRYYYEHYIGSGTYKDSLSLEKPNYYFDADHGVYIKYES